MKALDLLSIVIVVTNILDLTHFPMWLLIVYLVLSDLSARASDTNKDNVLDELKKQFNKDDE